MLPMPRLGMVSPSSAEQDAANTAERGAAAAAALSEYIDAIKVRAAWLRGPCEGDGIPLNAAAEGKTGPRAKLCSIFASVDEHFARYR